MNSKYMLDNNKLPYQEDEIRPEGVVDHEQAPPEIAITPADYTHIPEDKRVISATLQNDDQQLKKFLKENKPAKIAPPPDKSMTDDWPKNNKQKKNKKPGKIGLMLKKLFAK